VRDPQRYVKVTSLEDPPAVLIVTCTDGAPVEGGTVTLQVLCVGQFVGAT